MWLNPQFPADLVTFTEEILLGKLYFLCSDNISNHLHHLSKGLDNYIGNYNILLSGDFD